MAAASSWRMARSVGAGRMTGNWGIAGMGRRTAAHEPRRDHGVAWAGGCLGENSAVVDEALDGPAARSHGRFARVLIATVILVEGLAAIAVWNAISSRRSLPIAFGEVNFAANAAAYLWGTWEPELWVGVVFLLVAGAVALRLRRDRNTRVLAGLLLLVQFLSGLYLTVAFHPDAAILTWRAVGLVVAALPLAAVLWPKRAA